MQKIFVTSDLHLGHKSIIRLAGRPFKDVEEMDRTIIDNWNKVVGKEDLVYILGDFSMKGKCSVSEYLDQLNGRLILITGNHDYIKTVMNRRFEKVLPYLEIESPNTGIKYVMCHYPLLSWNGFFRNSVMLHGHIHKKCHDFEKTTLPNIYNVCCEFHNYTPRLLDSFKPVDVVKKLGLEK